MRHVFLTSDNLMDNNLLHRSKAKTLPTHSSAEELANKFGNFFHDKVQLLHAALKTSPCPRPDIDTSSYITKGSGPINPRQELTMLTAATQKEVSNLLTGSYTNSAFEEMFKCHKPFLDKHHQQNSEGRYAYCNESSLCNTNT